MRIRRREFIAGLGGAGAGLGLGGASHWLPLASPELGPEWSPGREEVVPSTCLLCPSHCGIRGRLVDGKLVRVDGNPLHPISKGGLCPKGRAGTQLLYHPGRLTGPVERTGPPGSDRFRPVTWDDALYRIASTLSELRESGDTATVAWLTGEVDGIMAELLQRFLRAYGEPHLLREGYADGSAEVMRFCQGIHAAPAFDLDASDLVLSFGAPLSEAWWSLPQAARARDAEAGRRPRWVQVDVRHSRTAAKADEWVAVRPGTYGTLALGLAYVILRDGLYDADLLRERVLGLEDWKDESGNTVPGYRTLVLRHGRTERISRLTGVAPEAIVQLAKSLGTARRPVAVWDQAVSWRAGGLADAMAIHALNILVSALNRPGGVLIQPPLPVRPLSEDAREEIAPAEKRESLTASNWAARVAGETPSPVNAMFLYYSNPVASAADAAEAARALQRIPLVVSFSPFLDETARHANLVLPDCTYLERWQDAGSPSSVPIPAWGVVRPMIPPLHDTRATGDVVLDLAARLGSDVKKSLPWNTVAAAVEARGRALAGARRGSVMAPALRHEELRELEARGWWLPHGQSETEFWESILASGGWFDPYYDYDDRSAISQFADGKVVLFPLAARRRISETASGLAEGFLPVAQETGEAEHDRDYPLRLVPYRVMTLASGNTSLMPWLLENLGPMTGDAWETWAEIHPETGHDLGLSSGQQVRVESQSGAFGARLRFFAGAQPGTVSVPYGLHSMVDGWGRPAGTNPLSAVGNLRDPATGLPDWYSTMVRVVPA